MLIPKNCTYIRDNQTLSEGHQFPNDVRENDKYLCGDYEYCYNRKASLISYNQWLSNSDQEGWGVRVLDKNKESYGQILSAVNGLPVTSLHNTFYECTKMKIAPEIPESIKDLWGTFSGCESLKNPPKIPRSIQKMQWTFEYCELLQEMPTIPEHIEDLTGTFADCISLNKMVLPKHIKTAAEKVFINCCNKK